MIVDRLIRVVVASLVFCCFTPNVSADPATNKQTGVLVYGATPGGIAAAVSAAKGGRSVMLIEPTDRIGGLVTSGLSYSDFRSFEALTGFFFEFTQRVQADYEVNLRVFEAMLAEHRNIKVIPRHRLTDVETTELVRGRRRIVSASFVDAKKKPHTIRAGVFIDASYEGDLMAAAGEPFHVGRESRDQYGEPRAGNERGEADGQVQGYNLRLIMTTIESNQRPTPRPDGYDRADFAAVLPIYESGKLKKVFAADRSGIFRAHLPLMPNGKTDVNDTPHAPVRLSMPDINDAYPNGDAKTRARIVRQHVYYTIGLLYFLQTDDAVPRNIREDARRWALCRDEFPETNGISPKLYIREARRMVGQHVFTEDDTRQMDGDARAVLHRDSIAAADYVHNCHGTGRDGSRFDGRHCGEFYKPVPPYQIPYGVIVPAKSENLLVPVACSASHFGFGALRLEPIWCSLGQAAGWAASLSLEDHQPVQELDVAKLQSLLHRDRSATIYLSDVPPTSPHFAGAQWFGTVGGFHGLAPAGQPKPKSLGGQYSEAFPGHAARLDAPLDNALAARWLKLVNVDSATDLETRLEFIAKARKLSADPQ